MSATSTLSAASQLPTQATGFITRRGSTLIDSATNADFYAVGANVYWLGLDENVVPNPSYPSRERVLEVLATARAMGATAIRSTTLGVSVGCPLCLMPSLDVLNAEAFEAIDFAVYAAAAYDLKLIIPLTDQYDYYHGGIASFLSFRNLSQSDHAPFYDLSSSTSADFRFYVSSILNHTSTITKIPLSSDPTIMAWETGNELKNPPIEWTANITALLKDLAPNQLVIDGTYGVKKQALSLNTIDVYSNHYYPLWNNKLVNDAKLVRNNGKAYIIGEFDWTVKYTKLGLLLGLVPAIVALICLFLPEKVYNRKISIPFTSRCRRRFKQNPAKTSRTSEIALLPDLSAETPSIQSKSSQVSLIKPAADNSEEKQKSNNIGFKLKKWHVVLFCLLWVPIIEGIVLIYGPASLDDFLGKIRSTSGVNGDLFWSLFGRNDNCTAFVDHNDGFTLHYRPGDSDIQQRGFKLTRHAYLMTGQQRAVFAASPLDINLFPVVGCPQASLTLPIITVQSSSTPSLSTSTQSAISRS